MIVGSLGTVVFSTSFNYMKTFNDLSKNKSANFIEHKIIGRKPKLQFNGSNLAKIKFKIHLNSFFKVNPLAEAEKLESYMDNGTVLRFIIGGKKVGKKGKYVINSINESHKAFSSLGTVLKIDLEVELQEYN